MVGLSEQHLCKQLLFFLVFQGVGGTHTAQRPSPWFAVSEDPLGDCIKYILLTENPRCSRGTWLFPEPLPVQCPGDKGPGGQHPPGSLIRFSLPLLSCLPFF